VDFSLKPTPLSLSVWTTQRFNPCFGGFFSKTYFHRLPPLIVNICFNPCFGGFFSKTFDVSTIPDGFYMCFNPCFGGFFSKTPSLAVPS